MVPFQLGPNLGRGAMTAIADLGEQRIIERV